MSWVYQWGIWNPDVIQKARFFAAAVQSWRGDKSLAKAYPASHLGLHGEKDNVIKPTRSRDMIKAISKAGGSPKYSEIVGRGHNSWVDCWNSDALWNWVFQSKN